MTNAPTFRQIFHGIWNMTFDVLRNAPRLVLFAFFILIAIELTKISFSETDLSSKILRALIDVVKCVALVPINIALYGLLLAEKPAAYCFDWSSQRFRRFLIWSVVFEVSAMPFMLFVTDSSGDTIKGVGAIALLVFLFVDIYVALRLTLLLPALAAGSENVSLHDAWADSHGRLWRLVKILLVPFALMIVIIPPGMAAMDYAGFQSDIADLSNWRSWLRAVFEAAISVFMELLMLAASALSFIWIGDRVKRGT